MVGKKYDKVYGWLFILPVFILAMVFFVIPAGMSLMLSFKEYYEAMPQDDHAQKEYMRSKGIGGWIAARFLV